jgi:hypothetical protein
MSDSMSRGNVITLLASASLEGRLGLFVGTGFSMAATRHRAPAFVELLKKLADAFELEGDFTKEQFTLKSPPQIASVLLAALSARVGSLQKAEQLFRNKVCELSNLVPEPDLRDIFTRSLNSAAPSWIVTTNYDLIIESLLEKAESVMAHQSLVPNVERLPVYHLHGHRHDPNSVKITEEDYVGLLSPFDYPRLKLPLLLSESTTLLLGYSLGDINVRVAMAWSNSLQRSDRQAKHPLYRAQTGLVVQCLYAKVPKEEPYRGTDGVLIVESDDPTTILTLIGEKRRALETEDASLRKKIATFLDNASSPEEWYRDTNKKKYFRAIIREGLSLCPVSRVMAFIDSSLDPVWKKAREDGGFQHYLDYLMVLLDTLEELDHRTASPNLLDYISRALDKVGRYVDDSKPPGTAHAATDAWLNRAPNLSTQLRGELQSWANSHDLFYLDRMLKMFPK